MRRELSAVQREVADLRLRIEELERRQGLVGPSVTTPATLSGSDTPAMPVVPLAAVALPPDLPAPSVKRAALTRLTHAAEADEPPKATTEIAPPVAPPIARPDPKEWLVDLGVGTPKTRKPAKAAKSGGLGDIEQMVGGRWFAVLGALAVTIAVGLFVHLAYKNGWLRVSPGARCAGAAGFGMLLIIVAEFLRKRLNAWAAFGGYAAGLGCVYVSVYAAWRLYDILPPAWCFVLLAATAVLGVGVGLRSRLAAVSIVGLVCGYAAPVLMYNAPSTDWVLPLYVLFLAAIGVSVSWAKGKGFHGVRHVAWIGTLFLGGLWSASQSPAVWMELGFLIAAWGLLQGELILSTRRGVWSGVGQSGRFFEGLSLVGSMILSAWFGLLGTMAATPTTGVPEWLPSLIAAGAAGFGAMLACGSPSIFLDTPRSAPQRLGSAMALQSAGLLVVAVALALSGPAEAVAWLAMALAAMFAGQRTNLLGIRLYAIALLAIGTGRLVVFDAWRSSMGVGTMDLWGMHLTAWAGLMGVAAALWLTASRVGLSAKASIVPRMMFVIVAGVLLVGGTVHWGNDVRAQVLVWVGVLAVYAATRPIVRPARPDVVATVLLLAPLLVWVFNECSTAWPLAEPPLMFAGFLLGMVLVGAWSIARWWVVRGGGAAGRVIGIAAGLAALVLFFADTSLEAARVVQRAFADQTAQRAAVSMWWGVFAAGLLTAGFMRATPWLRHVGLALLGAAGLKVVIYDLAGVGQVWRIASFMALGLLMLGVAVVYAKATKGRVAAEDELTAP